MICQNSFETIFLAMTDRINKLRAFIEKQPGDSFLQHALGLEYIKLGNAEAAEETFKALLDQNPAYVGSYYHLGKLLEKKQETTAAIHVYEKGIEVAGAAGDDHAKRELQGALDDILSIT